MMAVAVVFILGGKQNYFNARVKHDQLSDTDLIIAVLYYTDAEISS